MWGFKGGKAQAQYLNLIDWQSEIKPFRSCFHGAAANCRAVANHAECPGERKSYSAGSRHYVFNQASQWDSQMS
jgi:hypothetical protein